MKNESRILEVEIFKRMKKYANLKYGKITFGRIFSIVEKNFTRIFFHSWRKMIRILCAFYADKIFPKFFKSRPILSAQK